MDIATECRPGFLRIALRGELDHHAAAQTLRETEGLLDRYLPRSCALDLSGLSFMDSSGVALILRVFKRMRESGGQLWVENPAAQAQRVLDAAGVDRLVRVRLVERETVQ